MPIVRYFVCVGCLLLALLFAADRYLPAPADGAGTAVIDKTIIRIHSARRLPERVVFDTRRPPMTAPAESLPGGVETRPRESAAAIVDVPMEEQKPLGHKPAAGSSRVKRSRKVVRRTQEPQLAFERREFSGWW